MLPDDVAIVTAASPVEILSAATADAVSALPVTFPVRGPTKLPDVIIPDKTVAVETPTSHTVVPTPTPAAIKTLPSVVLIANSPTSSVEG